MRLQRLLSAWLLVSLITALSIPTSFGAPLTPRRTGSVGGRVIDPSGNPVAGAVAEIVGRAPVHTDRNGQFTFSGLPATGRLAISLSAPGFVSTTRIYMVAAGASVTRDQILWPRATAVILDVARGGTVRFPEGGGVTIPARALVDQRGRPLTGKVRASLTLLDVSNAAQLRAAPGDFTASMRDSRVVTLESFGIFEIFIESESGQRADLASGRVATVELPIPKALQAKAPDRVGSFWFDRASARWIEAGNWVRSGSEGGLHYQGTINQFDWSWNADDPTDTVCISIKVVNPYSTPPNQPEPNCYVSAQSVSSGSSSSGYTNSQGLVCLLVKPNDQVQVQAFSSQYSNWVSVPVTMPTPNFSSGASACGDCEQCPQTKIILDLIVGVGQHSAPALFSFSIRLLDSGFFLHS